MKLWLIRHADARTGRAGERDFDRDLSEIGNDTAERFGNWLAKHPDRPERIVASDAVRARATAAWGIRCTALGAAALQLDRRLYNASAETILHVIGETTDIASLAVVGHNPGMSHLAAALIGSDAPTSLPPLGVVLLETHTDWSEISPGTATLVSYTHPGDNPW